MFQEQINMRVIDAYLKENIPTPKVGDTVLVGRWKNRRAVVQGFGKDKNNQPTMKTDKGEYSLYRFRLASLMPPKKK